MAVHLTPILNEVSGSFSLAFLKEKIISDGNSGTFENSDLENPFIKYTHPELSHGQST